MKRFKTILFALAMVVCTAAVAWASDAGGEGEHHNDWGNFAFRVVNFIIFVGIIWFFAGKKIKEFFGSRRYTIETELADLEKRKETADQKLKEVERNIANMEQERASILEDYKKQGENVKAAIIEKAQAQAAQITEQAKATAENEAKYAVEEIRAELADLVTDATQKILEEKLTAEEHEKLIDKYLTKVVFN